MSEHAQKEHLSHIMLSLSSLSLPVRALSQSVTWPLCASSLPVSVSMISLSLCVFCPVSVCVSLCTVDLIRVRVMHVNANDLPVSLALVDQRKNTKGLHLLHLSDRTRGISSITGALRSVIGSPTKKTKTLFLHRSTYLSFSI